MHTHIREVYCRIPQKVAYIHGSKAHNDLYYRRLLVRLGAMLDMELDSVNANAPPGQLSADT